MANPPEILPTFRQDLQMYKGPMDDDGSPTFSLYDPIKGQYYKIGWKEAEIMKLIKPGMTPQLLINEVKKKTSFKMTENDVKEFFTFAAKLDLLAVATTSEKIQEKADEKKKSLFYQYLNFYLYYRLPLINPDNFLGKTLKYVRFLGSVPAFCVYALIAAAGIFLISGRWDEYFHTFQYFFTWEGFLAYAIALTVVKVIHEFAHAYTAKNYGVNVTNMGVALIIFWPVLYTDVTHSWRLSSRKQRIAITVAGIVSEIVIAGMASVLWALTSPGIWQSVFFIVSSVTWLISVLFNMNPAMKFDGYYLLSDLLGIDNLQTRAFAITRWKLHEWLLGIQSISPDPSLSNKRVYQMVAYSLFTWVYRLLIMTGIALVVYYKFTKSIGLLMLIGVMYNYLGSPIINEVKELIKEAPHLKRNARILATTVAVSAFLIWALVPFPHAEQVPAIVIPVQEQVIYVPHPGILKTINVTREDQIQRGKLIATISSEELNKEIEKEKAQRDVIIRELTIARDREKNQPLIAEKQSALQAAEEKVKALEGTRTQMTLRANEDGKLFDWDIHLKEGQYVSQNQVLGKIAKLEEEKLIAFVPENVFSYLYDQQKGTFILNSTRERWRVKVDTISFSHLTDLRYPSMSSQYKGPIPVSTHGNSQEKKLQPVETFYPVYFTLEEGQPPLMFGQRGFIEIRGPWRSKAVDVIKKVLNTLQKESSL